MITKSHEQHKAKLTKIEKMALKLVSYVGTMEFFIACVVLAIMPFIIPSSMPVVQYVSSGFLQLVLLPLILFGQNVQSRLEDIKSENMYLLTKEIWKKENS